MNNFGEGIIGTWATGAVPIRSGLSTINQGYLTDNVNLKLMDRMRVCQYFTVLLRLTLLRPPSVRHWSGVRSQVGWFTFCSQSPDISLSGGSLYEPVFQWTLSNTCSDISGTLILYRLSLLVILRKILWPIIPCSGLGSEIPKNSEETRNTGDNR